MWWVLGLLGTLGAVATGLLSAAVRHSRVVKALAFVGLCAIVVPVLLALTPLDYVNERNVIAAWPVLAMALGCLLALSRRSTAALSLALIAIAGSPRMSRCSAARRFSVRTGEPPPVLWRRLGLPGPSSSSPITRS